MKNEKKKERAPFLGFTCFSRQDYYPQLKDLHLSLKEQDGVLFGLYYDDEGCKAEMSMTWEVLQNEPVPCLKIFPDAFCLLGEDAFRKLFSKLNSLEDPQITPDQFSNLLITLGFRDMSDKPLVQR